MITASQCNVLNQCLQKNQAQTDSERCKTNYQKDAVNIIKRFQEKNSGLIIDTKKHQEKIHQLEQDLTMSNKRKEEAEAKIVSCEDMLQQKNLLTNENRELTAKLETLQSSMHSLKNNMLEQKGKCEKEEEKSKQLSNALRHNEDLCEFLLPTLKVKREEINYKKKGTKCKRME